MNILTKELNINSKYYKQILSMLKSTGASARLVGGSVRDALLNKKKHGDIDIITTLLPEQVIDILSSSIVNAEAFGARSDGAKPIYNRRAIEDDVPNCSSIDYKIKVIPTGLQFGTVTALLYDEKFEITTLRKDIESNGRHTKVIFTDDFIEDAARRDFTINALSYCPFEHKIYDYFNGIEDLQQSKVIFIGQAQRRIQEDYLRILRFFRFSCYYAKQLDSEGLKACSELKNCLNRLSKERIKWEMDKLIISDNSPNILQQMFNNGILQIIMPIDYFDQNILKKAINVAEMLTSEIEPYTRYSILFDHIKGLALRDLVNLKFSKQESMKICDIINIVQAEFTEFTLKKIWLENIDYIQYIIVFITFNKLNLSTAQEFIRKYNLLLRPKFPITGDDLLKFNIVGKDIGNYLNYLKKFWLESDFTLNKTQLIELLLKNINILNHTI